MFVYMEIESSSLILFITIIISLAEIDRRDA